jgi:hypothetical protein
MQKRSTRGVVIWLVVAVLMATGCTALAYMSATKGSSRSLRAFPEDCDIVVTVDLYRAARAIDDLSWAIQELTDVKVDSDLVLTWLQETLARWEDPGAAYASRLEGFGQAPAVDLEDHDSPPAIDLRSDILPWIGRDLTIGVDYDFEGLPASALGSTDLDPTEIDAFAVINYLMCSVSCRDVEGAKTLLSKFEALLLEDGDQPAHVTIGGHDWCCVGYERIMVLFGVVEDQLIGLIAPLDKVIPTLERTVALLESGKGSVQTSSAYRTISDRLGEGEVLSLFMNFVVDPSRVYSDELTTFFMGPASTNSTVEEPSEVRMTSLFRFYADGTQIRLAAAERHYEDQLALTAVFADFDMLSLSLHDTASALPEQVVGFMQLGSLNEYWSLIRSVLDSYVLRASADGPGLDLYGQGTLGDLLPPEMLSFIDMLMSHFVGDTLIALTGNSAYPMPLLISQVRDGEMLVSYIELLATQSVPGVQILFSQHGDILVKTLCVRGDAGVQPVVSYCLVDDMLVVSNMEPAVRLVVDTVSGVIGSVEGRPAVAQLRDKIGEGGLFLFHVDAGSLVEFLRPLEVELLEDEAKWIRAIGSVLEGISGYETLDGDLLIAELEVTLKPSLEIVLDPSPDVLGGPGLEASLGSGEDVVGEPGLEATHESGQDVMPEPGQEVMPEPSQDDIGEPSPEATLEPSI